MTNNKYEQALAQYETTLDDAIVMAEVEKIVADNFARFNTPEVWKFSLGAIDLTTLNATDNEQRVAEFTRRVNSFEEKYAELPNVASICVYPNFAEVVDVNLEASDVNITAVAAGFPSSQTFPEIKVAECAMAVKTGADEIDIVITIGEFLQGQYEEMCDAISECKAAIGDKTLKVILETGALKSATNSMKASLLAMYADADFVKTSTGKLDPAATPEAVYVMCKAVKAYYEKTGRKVGVKVAGGVKTPDDAAKYYAIVHEVLGEEWLNKDLYRIGASSAANNLLSAIVGEEVQHFM